MALNQPEHVSEGEYEMSDYVGNDDDVPNDDTPESYKYIDFYSTKDIVENQTLRKRTRTKSTKTTTTRTIKPFAQKIERLTLTTSPKMSASTGST
jgi:hypothetical protein